MVLRSPKLLPFFFCFLLSHLISFSCFDFLLLRSAASAQHAAHVIPRVPQELLERPVALRSGIGLAHDTVATKSAEAQRFYDQGLAYLHNYVWIEAARSLNQALRLDANLALAHVGLSYAYSELNQPDAAAGALDRAKALSVSLPDHDRQHVTVRAAQFAAEQTPGDKQKFIAYRQVLDGAAAAFPRDVEFALLRGIAESGDPADRGQGSVAGSIKYFQQAQALAPTQFAAHHYLTHATENAGRIDEALMHGRTYAQMAPEIPHARHMYGHNLRRANRVDEAIVEFEAADRLQRAYFKNESVAAEYDWHHHHNLDLLASSYQYLGQMKKAESLRKAAFALPSNLTVQIFNKRDWPAFLRSRGRLAEALAAARTLAVHPHPLIQATGHIEAGYTLLAGGRLADGALEFNTALKTLRAGAEGGPIAATALLGLQGELSLRSAQREKGRQVLEDVAKRVRAAPGPDNWVQALFTLEALARTARQVGDWALADRLAKQMIEHDPSYAGSHYALALVAERNGDLSTARREFALANKFWTNADADLPELVESRKKSR